MGGKEKMIILSPIGTRQSISSLLCSARWCTGCSHAIGILKRPLRNRAREAIVAEIELKKAGVVYRTMEELDKTSVRLTVVSLAATVLSVVVAVIQMSTR